MSPIPSPGFIAGPDVPKAERELARKKVQGWNRARKDRAFALGAGRVAESLARFPKLMWGFRPARNKWCIGEVLWHLADQEANLYVRLRKAAAEPGGNISSWDQDLWAARTRCREADFNEALQLFKLLRDSNAHLLGRLPPRAWKNKVKHPDYGAVSVDYLVGLNVWHVEHHIGQMAKRYREWKERRKK